MIYIKEDLDELDLQEYEPKLDDLVSGEKQLIKQIAKIEKQIERKIEKYMETLKTYGDGKKTQKLKSEIYDLEDECERLKDSLLYFKQ